MKPQLSSKIDTQDIEKNIKKPLVDSRIKTKKNTHEKKLIIILSFFLLAVFTIIVGCTISKKNKIENIEETMIELNKKIKYTNSKISTLNSEIDSLYYRKNAIDKLINYNKKEKNRLDRKYQDTRQNVINLEKKYSDLKIQYQNEIDRKYSRFERTYLPFPRHSPININIPLYKPFNIFHNFNHF